MSTEPYYSQRARSVCVSLSAFFIVVVVVLVFSVTIEKSVNVL